MKQDFDLEEYLNNGVEKIIKDALKATFKAPRQSTFLVKYASSLEKAKKLRSKMGKQNEHIPLFLIASITSRCNLHCTGCYACQERSCTNTLVGDEMNSSEWNRIFTEASDLGISFILLAGGEPLIRKDILDQVVSHQNILFPVFTNSTLIDEQYLSLFDSSRNLVPILSIEGDQSLTDARRGSGIFHIITKSMEALHKKSILYGVSITVTSKNLAQVTGKDFLSYIKNRGCKVVIYVEYVPVAPETKSLALSEHQRNFLAQTLLTLRSENLGMIVISFPGDELASGGCLAAGRGFFHINPYGGAEPCPFSPYSDTSLRTSTLRDALQSPLFAKLKSEEILQQSHSGGCVLFEKRETVAGFLQKG